MKRKYQKGRGLSCCIKLPGLKVMLKSTVSLLAVVEYLKQLIALILFPKQ